MPAEQFCQLTHISVGILAMKFVRQRLWCLGMKINSHDLCHIANSVVLCHRNPTPIKACSSILYLQENKSRMLLYLPGLLDVASVLLTQLQLLLHPVPTPLLVLLGVCQENIDKRSPHCLRHITRTATYKDNGLHGVRK